MKLVFLNPTATIGGAERVLLDLADGLRRVRPQWHLALIAPGDGPLLQAAQSLGVETTTLRFPPALASVGDSHGLDSYAARWRMLSRLGVASPALARYGRALRDLVAQQNPDLLHSNGLKMHFLSTWCAPRATPVLWHVHDYVGTRRLIGSALRMRGRRCDAIAANSHSVAADVREQLKPAAPIHTVLNGIDLERFRPSCAPLNLDVPAGLNPAADLVRVGLVATTARWKGHELFMRALALIPPDRRVRGYIIGAPIYATRDSQFSLGELRVSASRLGVSDRLGFTGYLDDVAGALCSLDIVVHASTRPEPFGLVIAEAMACGRALISSGEGGASELLAPNHDALTFRSGDAQSLADAMMRMVDNPGLRERLGSAAHLSAQSKFDRRRMTDQFIKIYEGLAAHPRIPNASAACS